MLKQPSAHAEAAFCLCFCLCLRCKNCSKNCRTVLLVLALQELYLVALTAKSRAKAERLIMCAFACKMQTVIRNKPARTCFHTSTQLHNWYHMFLQHICFAHCIHTTTQLVSHVSTHQRNWYHTYLQDMREEAALFHCIHCIDTTKLVSHVSAHQHNYAIGMTCTCRTCEWRLLCTL